MRKYIIFFVVLAFYSCNNYKYIYGVPGTQKQNEVFKNAGYLNDNQAFLCFTRNFDNDKIRVVQNGSIIFVGEISTYEGMSKVLKIDKLTNVVIEFGGISKLTLTSQQMSKYRSIYIYKDKNKGYVHFFDGTKVLPEDNTFFPIYLSKSYNCKIIQIDSSANSYLIKFHKTGLFQKKREELLIVGNVDTIVNDLPRLKIGKIYKLTLNDKFYNETMNKLKKTNGEKFYYDEDDKLIWEKKTDKKFYTTNNIINLNYIKQ